MTKLCAFISLLIVSILFTLPSSAQGPFHIQVKIDTAQNFNGKYVYFSFVDYSNKNDLKEDSVLINNNHFEYHGNLKTPGILTNIYMKEKDVDGLFQFLLVPGVNKFYTHKPLFNEVTGKAIRGFTNMEILENKDALIYNRYNSIYKVLLPEYIWALNNKKEMNQVFPILNKEFLPLRIAFARLNPQSYTSLYVQKYFLFNELEDKPDLIKELYDGLSDAIKQLAEGQELAQKIHSLFELKQGAPVRDFTIKDIDGKIVKLSDFKGKKVLLEFWASWCVPCIKNIPKLKKFADNNPQVHILAISLDDNKEDWKKAIHTHNFSFVTHVSELKGTGSDISSLHFNVKSIPRAILIDEDGKLEELDYKIK